MLRLKVSANSVQQGWPWYLLETDMKPRQNCSKLLQVTWKWYESKFFQLNVKSLYGKRCDSGTCWRRPSYVFWFSARLKIAKVSKIIVMIHHKLPEYFLLKSLLVEPIVVRENENILIVYGIHGPMYQELLQSVFLFILFIIIPVVILRMINLFLMFCPNYITSDFFLI